jgi:hypothetical protein
LSCLTGALHECNFFYSCHAPVGQNESSSYTESCIYVMLQSGRMNQVLDQVVVCMQCSSQAGRVKFFTKKLHSGAWHKYNVLVMNFIHPTWLKNNMDTTSWSWTWLVLPDWSIAWMQFLCKELDSSCLTGALHAYNYLVKNLTHPAWLEHDINTTFCVWTWLILPDWSITWIQLPVQELDSSYLTQEWHEYNFLVMNLTHPV